MSGPPEEDDIIRHLRLANLPITRENYLDLFFMGEVPEEISWEHELELPAELRRRFQRKRSRRQIQLARH